MSKLQRVILAITLCCVLAQAGWFSTDKTDRAKKRMEAAEAAITKTKKILKPELHLDADLIGEEDAPLDDADIKAVLKDKTIIDTITPEDNLKLKNDEILQMWE